MLYILANLVAMCSSPEVQLAELGSKSKGDVIPKVRKEATTATQTDYMHNYKTSNPKKIVRTEKQGSSLDVDIWLHAL